MKVWLANVSNWSIKSNEWVMTENCEMFAAVLDSVWKCLFCYGCVRKIFSVLWQCWFPAIVANELLWTVCKHFSLRHYTVLHLEQIKAPRLLHLMIRTLNSPDLFSLQKYNVKLFLYKTWQICNDNASEYCWRPEC